MPTGHVVLRMDFPVLRRAFRAHGGGKRTAGMEATTRRRPEKIRRLARKSLELSLLALNGGKRGHSPLMEGNADMRAIV